MLNQQLSCRFNMAKFDKKAFEFRKLLAGLSDGLGRDNIRSLVNLHYQDIPAKKRDEIIGAGNGLEFFNILKEKKMIDDDNVEHLVKLLTEIGRLDLVDKVKDYMDRIEGDIPAAEKVSDTFDQGQLMRIANDVGKDWKMLSRYLGLDETTIQTIQQQSQLDLKEASLMALKRWQTLAGPEKATPRALKKALTEMHLMGIVHTHFL